LEKKISISSAGLVLTMEDLARSFPLEAEKEAAGSGADQLDEGQIWKIVGSAGIPQRSNT
jgi:hypothetical protein